jgi:hypothetical protein
VLRPVLAKVLVKEHTYCTLQPVPVHRGFSRESKLAHATGVPTDTITGTAYIADLFVVDLESEVKA